MPSLSNNDITVRIQTSADTKGVEQAESSLEKFGNVAKDSGTKSETLNTGVGKLSGTFGALGTVFASLGIVSQIENFGTAIFTSAGQLEQTNISFQNLIGDVQTANGLFADLTQYAFSTPFESADLTGSAKQLLAFGEDAKNVFGTVKKLGDVTAAGGGDLQALSLVTGQIFAQGKLRAQDMYQVINDGGAGVIKIMAANAGGMQKLTDMFNAGGVPAQMYFDAINQATSNGGFAFDATQKQAQTFDGQLSSLKDSVTQLGLSLIGVHMDPQLGLVIDKGGLFDRAKDIISGLVTGFSDLQKNSSAIGAIAGAIGGLLLGSLIAAAAAAVILFGWIPLAIAGIAIAIGALVGVIVANWQNIVDFTTTVWNGIVDFFNGVGQGIGDVFKAIGDWVAGVWKGIVDGVTGAFNGVFDFIKQWGMTILAIVYWPFAILVGLFFKFRDQIAGFLTGVWGSIVTIFRPVVNFFGSVFGAAWNLIVAYWSFAIGFYVGIWNGIVAVFTPVIGFFAGIFQGAWNAVTGVFGAVGGFFTGVWNTIVGIFTGIGGAIGDAIGGAFKSVLNFAMKTGIDAINTVIGALDTAIDIINNIPNVHIPKIDSLHVPQFATGVRNFGGGLAVVGEQGPELVSLPSGSNVYTNRESQQMAGGSSQTITIQNLNLNTGEAVKSLFDMMDRDSQLRAMGLTPSRGRA